MFWVEGRGKFEELAHFVNECFLVVWWLFVVDIKEGEMKQDLLTLILGINVWVNKFIRKVYFWMFVITYDRRVFKKSELGKDFLEIFHLLLMCLRFIKVFLKYQKVFVWYKLGTGFRIFRDVKQVALIVYCFVLCDQ